MKISRLLSLPLSLLISWLETFNCYVETRCAVSAQVKTVAMFNSPLWDDSYRESPNSRLVALSNDETQSIGLFIGLGSTRKRRFNSNPESTDRIVK